MAASWQNFDFGSAVEQVVIGLAHCRQRHTGFFAQPHHLGNAPAAKVRQAKAANFARADQIAQGQHGFFKVFIMKVAVQVKNVEVVGLQARQHGVGFLDQPAA